MTTSYIDGGCSIAAIYLEVVCVQQQQLLVTGGGGSER